MENTACLIYLDLKINRHVFNTKVPHLKNCYNRSFLRVSKLDCSYARRFVRFSAIQGASLCLEKKQSSIAVILGQVTFICYQRTYRGDRKFV